ncbi:HhH-GPD superfamily base excision DNA repair protein [Aspergillus parasiticus SU-1]|uniref:HhH-GPD superfamily base excision DNA repair protein n=1 Tax=Aspergillus parasiticus (strain ATCC 56775 / NRRL 5862 / SRRC 143 / SU-1) TaxID=1403190 RepID=A0A0F0I477_ASPPU|nr:HhH-GPD superfamily base excision DNA repair protein [Aspergillus parasiticus SU-1]
MSHKKEIQATELGIDLSSRSEPEYFKWFLACLLFGKPVQQGVAKRAFLELVQEGITSPNAILAAGWDRLVEILDEGHYVRYDFSTATKLLDVAGAIKEEYGTFGEMLKRFRSVEELEMRLQEFRGVGPKTVEIFMRDMRPLLE